MRVVLVKNGIVSQAYNGKSLEELESALGKQGGEYLAHETAVVGSRWPEVEAAQESDPEPMTTQEVTAQLDQIRQQLVTDYIAQWGYISKRDMWPELDSESRELASFTDAALALPEKYSAITGFLLGSGVEEPTAIQIHETASKLRGYKSRHIQLLRRSEIVRTQLIEKYQNISDTEKLNWNSQSEWDLEYGA